MHRTEGLDHVGNKFDPGDPLAPRYGTEVQAAWLNAVQEELAKTIEAGGLTLRTAADDATATYGGQLLTAIDKLSPVKAACLVTGTGALPTLGPTLRNVAGVSLQAAGGGAPKRLRVTFTTPLVAPISASVTPRRDPLNLIDNVTVWPIVWALTANYLEFYVHAAVYALGTWSFSTQQVDFFGSHYDIVVIGGGA